MKKVFFLLLALAGTAPLFAQFFDMASQKSTTENIFNSTKPKSLRNNFDFRLSNSNKMTLEFTHISQFEALVNVDSLVAKVWEDLQPLRDSLSKPLVNRRIDFNVTSTGNQVRIVEYQPTATTYKFLRDEIVQTKIEQDTLRIRLSTPWSPNLKGVTVSTNAPGAITTFYRPYFVMLILNNISDVASLPINSLNNAIEVLRKDLAPSLKKNEQKEWRRFYAMYDVTGKKISPLSSNHFGFGKRKSLEPYVQLGLQYIRGSWAASSAVGLQYVRGYYDANRQIFKLYWEPHFLFYRDAADKLIPQRNDFVTLKYNEIRGRQTAFPSLNTNFSLSYLVGKRGNFFEPATFKIAFPGLRARNLNLEPEFVFNKFFKNFSPSIKLSLEIE